MKGCDEEVGWKMRLKNSAHAIEESTFEELNSAHEKSEAHLPLNFQG